MILLDKVTKSYSGDKKPALNEVSLHIEPNEFVFLVGKSGAGKSTLLKMITKEETPDEGKIIIGGIDLDYVKKRHIPHYRRRLGVVFQDFKLLPSRTVYENVAFALEIAGMSNRDIRKTVPKVLELVDLTDEANKFPSQISGGQQQRVSIARSVARQPKILIADEPTGNLDKLTRKEIIDLLQKINDFGTTVLVTTHDENIVNYLKKRVITLKDGKIVADQKNNGIYRLESVSERLKNFHPGINAPRKVISSAQLSPSLAPPIATSIHTVSRQQASPARRATPPVSHRVAPPEQSTPSRPAISKQVPSKQASSRTAQVPPARSTTKTTSKTTTPRTKRKVI